MWILAVQEVKEKTVYMYLLLKSVFMRYPESIAFHYSIPAVLLGRAPTNRMWDGNHIQTRSETKVVWMLCRLANTHFENNYYLWRLTRSCYYSWCITPGVWLITHETVPLFLLRKFSEVCQLQHKWKALKYKPSAQYLAAPCASQNTC